MVKLNPNGKLASSLRSYTSRPAAAVLGTFGSWGQPFRLPVVKNGVGSPPPSPQAAAPPSWDVDCATVASESPLSPTLRQLIYPEYVKVAPVPAARQKLQLDGAQKLPAVAPIRTAPAAAAPARPAAAAAQAPAVVAAPPRPTTLTPAAAAASTVTVTTTPQQPPSPDRTAERRLVTQLLSHFKKTPEVRQYLKYYGSVDSDRFAIVKISGDVLNSEAETARVASSLAFLHRLGLVPIVVHGAGVFSGRRSAEVAQAAADAPAGSSPAERRRRLLLAAEAHMAAANARLVAALAREGVAAAPLTRGVFSAEATTAPSSGAPAAVGAITGVNVGAITASVAAGAIPVVAALGCSALGEEGLVTFSTRDATTALARAVVPLKVIYLRPEGGVHRADGSPLPAVDLARDAPELAPGATPADADASSLATVAGRLGVSLADAQTLAELGALHGVLTLPGATVSVTSPEGLAQELLTTGGAGTLVTRGERILALDAAAATPGDLARVTALVEEAFGAALPEGYLAGLAASGRLKRIYLSEACRGAAIVTTEPGVPGSAYLDKFAVAPSAQGDKLGEVLWRAMTDAEPSLFWRSRASNRVNPWYFAQSDGSYKTKSGDWTVFWRGLDDEQIMAAITTARALPPTFAAKVYPAPEAGAPAAAQQPVLK